jgi:hypothetical protein
MRPTEPKNSAKAPVAAANPRRAPPPRKAGPTEARGGRIATSAIDALTRLITAAPASERDSLGHKESLGALLATPASFGTRNN